MASTSRHVLLSVGVGVPIVVGIGFCVSGMGDALESNRAWFGWWHDVFADEGALESFVFAGVAIGMGLGWLFGVLLDRVYAKLDVMKSKDEAS